MYIGLHVEYQLCLSHFNECSVFSTDFRKNAEIPIFTKIRPVGSELFHADGQTDTMKKTVFFFDFAKAPKISRFVFTVIKVELLLEF